MTTDGLGPIPQCWVDWAEETNQQRRGFVAAHSQGGCLMPTLAEWTLVVEYGNSQETVYKLDFEAMPQTNNDSGLSRTIPRWCS